jgi:hypothetical protein
LLKPRTQARANVSRFSNRMRHHVR